MQYSTIETYNGDFSVLNKENFQNTRKYESKLAKIFRRVVTGRKCNRSILILFPKDFENYADLILEVRKCTNIVNKSNPSIFLSQSWNDRSICGYYDSTFGKIQQG